MNYDTIQHFMSSTNLPSLPALSAFYLHFSYFLSLRQALTAFFSPQASGIEMTKTAKP